VNEPIQKPCPHAKCDGTIYVHRDMRNGTYDCVCHAIKLRVSWMTMASFERVPMLSVEPRGEEGPA
jgi:hypothetical protein